MAEKTPVSVLQELCVKHNHGAPFYEELADGSDEEKTFSYMVQAFGQTAQGTGRSKKEAKHEAAVNILGRGLLLCGAVDVVFQTKEKNNNRPFRIYFQYF